jgi:hypothetical protein
MIGIREIHEQLVYNNVSMYGKRKKNLRNEPAEQLMSLRKNCHSFVVYQTPYHNSIGYNRWNDFSIYNKQRGIDCRIEVKSLIPPSALKNAVYGHIMEARNMVENEMIIVLFGEGYDDQIIRGAKQLIAESNVNVRLITSIEELKKHLDSKGI